MQYLYDYTGRQYFDTVNNVSHVGHCHPNVAVAMQQQSGVLTANTHYLHAQIASYSERLLAKFPVPLEVCFLVNSGSEANDLALRLARNYTRRNDTIVLDHAYHGNLTSLIEISPYKHNGAGGRRTQPYSYGNDARYVRKPFTTDGSVSSLHRNLTRTGQCSPVASTAATKGSDP